MKELVVYNLNGDPSLVEQNMELALNVLKSSALPLPEPILQMDHSNLLSDDQCLLSILEVLKQTADILDAPQTKSPLKPS